MSLVILIIITIIIIIIIIDTLRAADERHQPSRLSQLVSFYIRLEKTTTVCCIFPFFVSLLIYFCRYVFAM